MQVKTHERNRWTQLFNWKGKNLKARVPQIKLRNDQDHQEPWKGAQLNEGKPWKGPTRSLQDLKRQKRDHNWTQKPQ